MEATNKSLLDESDVTTSRKLNDVSSDDPEQELWQPQGTANRKIHYFVRNFIKILKSTLYQSRVHSLKRGKQQHTVSDRILD